MTQRQVTFEISAGIKSDTNFSNGHNLKFTGIFKSLSDKEFKTVCASFRRAIFEFDHKNTIEDATVSIGLSGILLALAENLNLETTLSQMLELQVQSDVESRSIRLRD